MGRRRKVKFEQMARIVEEAELHRLLDLLGAPKGEQAVKRLREYLESRGVRTVYAMSGWRARR